MAKSHAFTVDGRKMTIDKGDLHKSLVLAAILMATVPTITATRMITAVPL